MLFLLIIGLKMLNFQIEIKTSCGGLWVCHGELVSDPILPSELFGKTQMSV